MNADMLNRETLFFIFLFFGGEGGERPFRPPLDPPLITPRFMQKRTRNLNEW